MTAKESDIIARKTAAYLQEMQQQPKSMYISENKAFDLFRQCNVCQWRADGLIQAHQRKSGRIEYKVTELQLAAAEIQYPIHKIRIKKNETI